MEQVFGKFPWVLKVQLPALQPHLEDVRKMVLDEYTNWTPPEGQFSFPVTSCDDFFERLYSRFVFECIRTFEPFTIHPSSNRQVWAYVQNAEKASPVWHDHLLTSTINGVYYLSVPDPEGQLWFRFREQELKVTPEEGWLYLFPRWLLHKPVAQGSSEYRISLNVELITNECPIARLGQWRW